MLYKDFVAQELECKDCPIFDAGECPGGCSSDGCGNPIEPPCCCFDDDTDMDEWIANQMEYTRLCEAAEDERIRKQKKRSDAAKKAADRRARERLHVTSERLQIKKLKNEIKLNNAAINLATAFSFASSMVERKELPSTKHPLELENEELRKRIAEIESIKRQKILEYRRVEKEALSDGHK